jgi:hypothetical protein
MSGIHDVIMEYVQAGLEAALITNVVPGDLSVAGAVKLGHLQGDPSPDDARISLTIHENDPDTMVKGSVSSLTSSWDDVIEETEIGYATTWRRRFSVIGRCLFATSGESLDLARLYASTVRQRTEETLRSLAFTSVLSGKEYVSMGAYQDDMVGEMLQAGGPPDSFDYRFKVRFSVLTTNTGV